MGFLIVRRDKRTGMIMYKQYKCIDSFSSDKTLCWQFSKRGAQKIVKRLTAEDKFQRYEYSIEEVKGE